MNYTRIISMVMMFLVITIPIAFSASVNSLTLSGSAHINGFRAATDTTIVEAVVESATPVNLQDLALGFGAGLTPLPFGSGPCTLSSGKYLCSFNTGTSTIPVRTYPCTLIYKGQEQSNTCIITVDDKAPLFSNSFGAEDITQNARVVAASYEVNDPQVSGQCSGMGSLSCILTALSRKQRKSIQRFARLCQEQYQQMSR